MRLVIVAKPRHYREALASAIAASRIFDDVQTQCSEAGCCGGSIPDIVAFVLLGEGEISFVAEAMYQWPDATFVAIALVEVEADLLACVRMGVKGLITHSHSVDEILSVLQDTSRGKFRWSKRITSKLIQKIGGGPTPDPAETAAREAAHTSTRAGLMPVLPDISVPARPYPVPDAQPGCPPDTASSDSVDLTQRVATECNLTARQQEVLSFLGDGLSNKEIARKLKIELPTVKHHVHEILRKLGVRGRSAAVAKLHRDYGAGASPSHQGSRSALSAGSEPNLN